MKIFRGIIPAFPPLEDEQAVRLVRVLHVMARVGLFTTPGLLFALYAGTFRPEQYGLVSLHRFIMFIVLGFWIASLLLMRGGRFPRIGGTLQILALWLSLTIMPDLTGAPIHAVAANHVVLAICIGPLAGWPGSLLIGAASLVYVLVQDAMLLVRGGISPLFVFAPMQENVIEISLYGMALSLAVLIVVYGQRRSEIGQVTAEALEVASFSEKKLDTIIESMADVMLVLELDGTIVKANRATFTLLGYTESELNGKPLRMLLLDIPEGSSGVEGMLRQQALRQVSRRLRAKDGRLLPVSLSSSPITDSEDSPTGIILVAQDMTELETVRMQLQQSYTRFNQAIQFSRIGVFEFDLETGEFIPDDVLRQAVKASGVGVFNTYEEFLTSVIEEDRPLVEEALDSYRRGDRTRIDVEFRVKSTRGPRWIMVRGALNAVSGPNLVGTFMDVTRRKRAEIELARRDEMLRAVTASSEAFLRSSDWEAQIPSLLREVGMAAHISRVSIYRSTDSTRDNAPWAMEYGWTAPGIRMNEADVRGFIPEGQGVEEYIARMRSREPIHGLVSTIKSEPLRTFLMRGDILSVAIMPIFVQDDWWGVVCFDDCQTERYWSEPELDALQLAADSLGAAVYRQRVERNLQENSSFLMSIMDNLVQGVLVMDGQTRVLFANAAITKLSGIPVEKIIGKSIDNLIDPEFKSVLLQHRVKRTHGETSSYPSRLIHVNGSKTDVFVTGVPRYVNGVPDGSYSLITDISESRRIEAAQMQLSTEREQMRIMSDFVRDASHDFRTPLSIIQTSLHLLRRKIDAPDILERLHTVGLQASRLSRLIDGLLTMLELDKADVTLVPINFRTVAQNCVDRARENAHKAGLSIDLSAPEEPCFVNGEEGYLMKAVSNLIENAIAFTGAGGRIKVGIGADENEVELTVSDTGIGIAPEEHERIFERLYKVDKARTIDSGGLGMGLTITKRITELHGGRISVKSAPGEGSAFMITLPRVKQAPPRQRMLVGSSPITEDVKM